MAGRFNVARGGMPERDARSSIGYAPLNAQPLSNATPSLYEDSNYHYALGDPPLTISDTTYGLDSIIFGAGINFSDLQLVRNGDDLIISVGGNPAVLVVGHFEIGYYYDEGGSYRWMLNDAPHMVEQLRFADGSIWRLRDISFPLTATEDDDVLTGVTFGGNPHDVIHSLGGNDIITGGEGDDQMFGGDGNDLIRGGGLDHGVSDTGDDRLDGGAGDDSLSGEGGDDTYIVGTGHDRVWEAPNEGEDTLILWNGITNADLTFSRYAPAGATSTTTDMVITNNLTGDSVLISRYFDKFYVNNSLQYAVLFEHILLGDGTPINDLSTHVWASYGSDGNDTLIGTQFNDEFVASAGHDRIYERVGEGNDTLTLWAGATLADISFERVADENWRESFIDLLITNRLTGDTIRVADYFETGFITGEIERYRLADGTTINMRARSWVTNGTAGSDTIYGVDPATGGMNDVINGLGGSDAIYGLGGNDILNGGDHSDTIFGGDGNDILDGGTGNDTLDGGLGDDIFHDGAGDDRLIGRDGNDVFYIQSGHDVVDDISGTADKLYLWTGVTFDQLEFSRIGNTDGLIRNSLTGDTVQIARFFVSPNGRLEQIWLGDGTLMPSIANMNFVNRGTDGDDTIFGVRVTGGRNDVLQGLGGNDRMESFDGNDTLDGGAGGDRMEGGEGNDLYIVDDTRDLVIELANQGTDTVRSLLFRYALPDNVENLIAWTADGQTLIGNALANRISGNAGNDILNGAGGADVMVGAAGDDLYYVNDAGDDVIEADGQGDDSIISAVTYSLTGRSVETLTLVGNAALNAFGNEAANTLNGNVAANLLMGNGGKDALNGYAGDDILNGGAGADRMAGGVGNDVFIVDHTTDLVIELAGQGVDEVRTGLGSYWLADGVERLTGTLSGGQTLVGNMLANRIIGRHGDDTINGLAGADVMIGGLGDDLYYVDNSNDRVVEEANGGNDSVWTKVSFSLAGQHIENLTLNGRGDIDATGNGLANRLGGNGYDNDLHGMLGNDIMGGGSGRDNFFFETALGANNIDRIYDFAVADDSIMLAASIFTAAGAGGMLGAAAFHVGARAADADDRIIYNPLTGFLSYDADGNGAGAAAVFAQLSAGLALTHADFVIF